MGHTKAQCAQQFGTTPITRVKLNCSIFTGPSQQSVHVSPWQYAHQLVIILVAPSGRIHHHCALLVPGLAKAAINLDSHGITST